MCWFLIRIVNFLEPQTFTLSENVECETKMHTEGPPVKAVPESIRRRPTPQSTFYKAVPACMQSRVPPPIAGRPWQIRPTWPGSPKEPSAEEVLPWTARERVDLDKMEKYVETTESIQVEVSELEHFLLLPDDADISIRSLAENARDEGGYSKFVLLNIPRGKEGGGRGLEVADAARLAEAAGEEWTHEQRLERRGGQEAAHQFLACLSSGHFQLTDRSFVRA